MLMLVVGLNGSYDNNGNTSFLINQIMDVLKERGINIQVENAMELLNDLKTPFCTACTNPCTGICYKEKKLEKFFELLRDADALIIGSPVYFGTVSAQLKAVFDKTRKLRAEKVLYNKYGVAVTVGASKYGGQETTTRAIHDMMLVHGMLIIGDGFQDDDCGHFGVNGQKPSKDDEYAIKRAQIIGKRIADVYKE
jgi:multimeric flavodoxin WrbA